MSTRRLARCSLLWAGIAVGSGGCVVAPHSMLSDMQRPLCYEITISNWTPAPTPDRVAVFSIAPQYIQLDTARHSEWIRPDIRRAHSLRDARWGTLPFNAWHLAGRDSLRVRECGDVPGAARPLPDCPPSLGGFDMRLAARGDDLRGRITWFTDALEPGKPSDFYATVIGHEVSCSLIAVG
jgi:hypothetical protein